MWNRRSLLLNILGCCLGSVLVACSTQEPVTDKRPTESAAASIRVNVARDSGAEGWMLAAACFGCHGPQGRSQAPEVPSLAGLSETYFFNVMQAYQYGGRYSSVMGRIAQGYQDGEIRRMARYFKAQTPETRTQRVNWREVGKGRQLHQRYCRDCHGDPTTQPDHDAVRLDGQWMNYLRWTLQDYVIGINQSQPEMADALADLMRRQGAAGLESLIHYYGSAGP